MNRDDQLQLERRQDSARRAALDAQKQANDAFSLCMSCWVSYMHVDDRDTGVSRMKLRSREEEAIGYESDPYAEQRVADLKTGEAVNAMVDSLTTVHRWAICKSQGLSNQWRFGSVDYATVLAEARIELEKKLRKNIATRIYFL